MKFGIDLFPVSTCDENMVNILQKMMKQDVAKLWSKDRDWQVNTHVIFPAGFSYREDLHSAAYARSFPIMEKLIEQSSAAAFLIRLCNGVQMLCKAVLLLPAFLQKRTHTFFFHKFYMKSEQPISLLSPAIPDNKALKTRIAKKEETYVINPQTCKPLNENKQIPFHSCNKTETLIQEAQPNGPLKNTEGVCNSGKTVFGLNPFPECEAETGLRNMAGRLRFELTFVETFV